MVIAEMIAPAELGMDSKRLDYADAHLRRYIEEGKFAGTVLLVARHGALVHFTANGLADCARARPMSTESIFRIYSMTKPLTSIAVMQLYERGLLQLDDPASEYLPEFRDLQVYAGGTYPDFQTRAPDREMTVRDLLSHQSGLTYGAQDGTAVDDAYRQAGVLDSRNGETLVDMTARLASLPLAFSPGAHWNYSVSTDVCGRLVEVISGRPLDEYIDENICQPLGMVDSGFIVPQAKVGRLTANYLAGEDGMVLIDDPEQSTYLKKPTLLSGGGGMVGTTLDYWKFAQTLCQGGELEGERIIGRKTLELMTSNHLPGGSDLMHHALGRWSETSFQGIGFGLGFSVTLDPAQAQVTGTPGEFSWGGAASTVFWVDPIEDLVVVFMTQLMPSTQYNIRRELRAIIYSALND